MISAESRTADANRTKGSVLIVDDNPDNLRLLSGMLAENNSFRGGRIASNFFYTDRKSRVFEQSFGKFDIFHYNSPDCQLQCI